ncbi:hypothetical protein PR048_019595, partial [Dryococelus australis]
MYILSTCTFYFVLNCYSETVGGKASNEVALMLHHSICQILDTAVQDLEVFCDLYTEQNKNLTILKCLHYMVCVARRLRKMEVTFPTRGHSYLECDPTTRNTPQKHLTIELDVEFGTTRYKTFTFHVVAVDQSLLRNWYSFLTPLYQNTCPFAPRLIREMLLSNIILDLRIIETLARQCGSLTSYYPLILRIIY